MVQFKKDGCFAKKNIKQDSEFFLPFGLYHGIRSDESSKRDANCLLVEENSETPDFNNTPMPGVFSPYLKSTRDIKKKEEIIYKFTGPQGREYFEKK